MYTNNDSRVNFPVIAIECLNFGWALVGLFVNALMADPKSHTGAIGDCMRDFGMSTSMASYMFMTISFAHLFRFAYYYGVFMNHRSVLGYLEARYRKNLLPRNADNQIEISFSIQKCEDESSVQCAICCIDFEREDKLVELPCSSQHVYHSACISEWLKRSNDCPLCKKDVVKMKMDE